MNDGWSLIILQLPWNKSLICDAPVATTPSVGWLQRGLHCPATKMEGPTYIENHKTYNINIKNLPLTLCVHRGNYVLTHPHIPLVPLFNSHKASKITTQPESVESSARHPTWWISIFPHPHFLLINMFGTISSNDGLLSSSQSQRICWDTNDP